LLQIEFEYTRRPVILTTRPKSTRHHGSSCSCVF
jgi:hypothetical protein